MRRIGRGRVVGRFAASFAALACASALWIQDARASNTPLYFGSNDQESVKGPVLSFAQIVPVFYGDWSNGVDETALTYLIGFKSWVAGAGDPGSSDGRFDARNLGFEPVLRQYGIWGASLTQPYYFAGSSSPLTENSVVSSIHQWQTQGLLPPTTGNTIFVVFVNGFSSYDWETPTTCAKHAVNANDATLYALVSLDGCTGGDIQQFERLTSHELEEAMTDPYMFLLQYGWVTHEGTGGLVSNEGADQCETSPDPPFPFGNPLPFGTVQNFTDNTNPDVVQAHPTNDGSRSGSICNTWARARSPRFALTRRSNTQLDVVYQDFSNGGALMHADFSQDYIWSRETIDSQPGPISGAPAVVSANDGQLDVFVRAIGTPDIAGGLVHWRKDQSMPFSPAEYILDENDDSGLGPPTAVSPGPGHIDVFTGDTYAGLAHFWSDGAGFTAEHFSQVFAITPPVAISNGSNELHVFTYNINSDLQDMMFNGSTWSVLDLDITDIFFNYPADLISAAAWNGPNNVPGSSIQIYVSGLILQFSPGRTIEDSFHRDENRGTVSMAASSDGSTVIAAFYTDGDPNAGDTNGAFYRVIRWSGNTVSPAVKITGAYTSPPAAIFGSDGFPEILGVGFDGCLYETWLDYVSGGQVVNGPNATGICGLR